MRVLACAEADLGPVSLDAVGQGQLGQGPAVVDHHPGELVERMVAIQQGDAWRGVAQLIHSFEPLRVT